MFDQPPEAVHPVAAVDVQVSDEEFPLCTLAGLALNETVGADGDSEGDGDGDGGGFCAAPGGGVPPLTPEVAPPQAASNVRSATATADRIASLQLFLISYTSSMSGLFGLAFDYYHRKLRRLSGENDKTLGRDSLLDQPGCYACGAREK